MCLIIYKPSSIYLKEEDLRKAWMSNPDGAGIAVRYGKGVKVLKGLMTFKDFLETLDPIHDLELVIHFRFATHGLKIPEQTHPFAISKNTINAKAYNSKKVFDSVLFHNGVIDNFGDKKYSDTLDFVSTVLAYLPDNETRVRVLELTGSKFVLMDAKELIMIGKFEKQGDAYYSNLYWQYTFAKGKDKSSKNRYLYYDPNSTYTDTDGSRTVSYRDWESRYNITHDWERELDYEDNDGKPIVVRELPNGSGYSVKELFENEDPETFEDMDAEELMKREKQYIEYIKNMPEQEKI